MNAKTTSLIAAAISLMSFLTFAAHAQESADTAGTEAPAFEELDKNEDGIITPEEAQGTAVETSFSVIDTNRDGYITKSEYEEATR